jgi:hypothetical protein
MEPEIVCPVLNSTTVRDPSLASDRAAPAPAAATPRASADGAGDRFIARESLLFVAPKTSPPLATA